MNQDVCHKKNSILGVNLLHEGKQLMFTFNLIYFMKHTYLLVLAFLFSKYNYSQNKPLDTIPNMKQDFSNRKVYDVSSIVGDYFKTKESTIVVIDNKFYSIDDRKFKDLSKDKINSIEVIKDEQSKLKIKYIIIIKTNAL